MRNQELEEILASMQQIVQQAYDLGRSEALKQVVELLKVDAPAAKLLALPRPTDETTRSATTPQVESLAPLHHNAPSSPPKPDNDSAATASTDAKPWYVRPPNRMW